MKGLFAFKKISLAVSVAVLIKLFYLAWFSYESVYGNILDTVGIMIIGGDTSTYLNPIEAFVNSGTLTACRMPGLLPIYGPLILIFSKATAANLLVVVQLIIEIVSIICLGAIAEIYFGRKVQYLTILIYSLVPFHTIYSLSGLSDSLHISFLIISLYLFIKYLDEKSVKWLLLSGLFIAWSIFLRQIAILPFIVLFCFLLFFDFRALTLNKRFKIVLIFMSPFLFFDSLWALNNYRIYSRPIVLVDSVENCFPSYPEQRFDLLEIPIRLGGSFVHWGGHEGAWFLDSNLSINAFPFEKNDLPSKFSLQKLDKLRKNYAKSIRPGQSIDSLMMYKALIKSDSEEFLIAYKIDNPFKYYCLNPIKLSLKFLFPPAIEGIPFPSREEMNALQFGFKAFQTIFFYVINLTALIGMFLFMFKQSTINEWFVRLLLIGVPLSMFSVLVFYFGWIEFRYFMPITPFFVIFSSTLLNQIFIRFNTYFLKNKT